MKRVIAIVFVVAVAALALAGRTSASSNTEGAQQTAVVEFNRTVKLLDVLLRGRYVVVHDEARMEQGLDCIYVYSEREGQPGRLIVSFHCNPVVREKAERFKVVVSNSRSPLDVPEVTEIQFAGTDEGHQVPTP